jgi:hypothetical protein
LHAAAAVEEVLPCRTTACADCQTVWFCRIGFKQAEPDQRLD